MASELISHRLPQADEYYYKQTNNHISCRDHETEIGADADAYFPLQPIEKKLCAYTFGLGIVLLFVFVILFKVL